MQTSVDNISPLNSSSPKNDSIDQVMQELEHWRSNKNKPSAPIPDALWKKIFSLANTHSESKIRALFGLSAKQYRNKYEQLHSDTSSSKPMANSANKETIKLRQVNKTSPVAQSTPIAAFNTMVVECCRSDGQVLKIHTTNENINTVIKAFYAGTYDAADNS